MTPVTHLERRLLFLRLGVSISLLLGLTWLFDASEIVSRLVRMEVTWVVSALAISIIQIMISAWRWRFTAGRLGVDLPFKDALREYYLATFLNQVLPGGVVGDISRAWRHAHSQAPQTAAVAAVHAVILERTSGQAVMMVVAAVSLLNLPIASGLVPRPAVLGVALAVGAVVGSMVGYGQRRSRMLAVARLWDDARLALLSGDALPIQLVTSGFVVGSYIATFLLAACAVGVDLPLVMLFPLVAPVLVTMLIPVTVAGWGVREGVAAVLWGLVGLNAVDGVSVSAAYGLLILLASVPGSLMLFLRPSADRVRDTHED